MSKKRTLVLRGITSRVCLSTLRPQSSPWLLLPQPQHDLPTPAVAPTAAAWYVCTQLLLVEQHCGTAARTKNSQEVGVLFWCPYLASTQSQCPAHPLQVALLPTSDFSPIQMSRKILINFHGANALAVTDG